MALPPPSLEAASLARSRVLALDKERKSMEQQIVENLQVLGAVGMHEPLVDGMSSDGTIAGVRTMDGCSFLSSLTSRANT